MFRFIQISVIALVAMIALQSCGMDANNPASVAASFLEKVAKADSTGAKALASDDTKAELDKYFSFFKEARAEGFKLDGAPTLSGDNASVKFKVGEKSMELALVKDASGWKVKANNCSLQGKTAEECLDGLLSTEPASETPAVNDSTKKDSSHTDGAHTDAHSSGH